MGNILGDLKMAEKEKKYTTVSIPLALAAKVKKRMKGTGFTSLSSYVTYVLRQVISSIEEEEKQKEVFSKEDEDRVKNRALGYLD